LPQLIKENPEALSVLIAEKENLTMVLQRQRHGELDACCQAVLYLSVLWERDAMARRAICYPLHLLGESKAAAEALLRAEDRFQPGQDRLGRISCFLYMAQAAIYRRGGMPAKVRALEEKRLQALSYSDG